MRTKQEILEAAMALSVDDRRRLLKEVVESLGGVYLEAEEEEVVLAGLAEMESGEVIDGARFLVSLKRDGRAGGAQSFQVAQSVPSQVSEVTRWLSEKVDADAAHRLPDEVADMIERVVHQPDLGPPAKGGHANGVRRVELRTLPYHLYYSVEEGQALTVLAVWHKLGVGRVEV